MTDDRTCAPLIAPASCSALADDEWRDPYADRAPNMVSANLKLWFVFACALSTLFGIYGAWRMLTQGAVDDDELQHLHFAWCIAKGLTPYADFWDNHTPGLHHLLARLLDLGGDPSDALQRGRLLIALSSLALVGVTFALGSVLFDRFTAAAASALFVSSEIFVDKATELRPDGFLSALCILALIAVVRSWNEVRFGRRMLWFLGSGIALGLGALFSPKALISLGSILLTLFLIQVKQPRRHRLLVESILAIGAGVALPIFSWLTYEYSAGAFGPALEYTFFESFRHPDRFNSLLALHAGWPYGFFLVTFIGGIWWLRANWGTDVSRAAPLIVLLHGVFCLSIYLAVMPAPYLQTALLFTPQLSVFGGYLAASQLRETGSAHQMRRSAAALWLTCIALVGVLQPSLRIQFRFDREQASLEYTTARMDWIHSWTSGDDVVFDGRCIAPFRMHAISRPSLVRGVLTAYHRGAIQPTIAEELASSGCTVFVLDERTKHLPESDARLIRSLMIPAEGLDTSIYFPGWKVELGPKSAVTVDVLTEGEFVSRSSNSGAALLVNGLPVSTPIELSRGQVELAASGETTVTLWRRAGQ